METLLTEVDALPTEALSWHPAEGEWCVNEAIGHLIETEERGFRGQIGRIIADPGRKLSDWDPPQVAKARRDCEKDGMELLRTLEQDRAHGVQMVGTTPATSCCSRENIHLSGRSASATCYTTGRTMIEST